VGGVADVVGVYAERELRPEFADIDNGEHAALPKLRLNARAHVDHARSLVAGRQHAAEIRHAVRKGVDIRPTGHRCLGRLKLRLQILNRGSNYSPCYGSPNRLPADLRGNV